MEHRDFFRLFLKDFFDKKNQRTRLSQKKIAEKAGVDPKQLSAFKNNKQTLGESARIRVADAIGIQYSECIDMGRGLAGIDKAQDKIISLSHQPCKQHHQLINKFQDKERAFDANKALLSIEENDPNAFHAVVNFLEMRNDEILKKKGKTPKQKRHSGKD